MPGLPIATPELLRPETQGGARPRLSVVAPCYNEATGLPVFHQRVTAACEAAVGEDYEIVLINDGSRDDTLAVMARLAADDPHLLVVNLARNYGHQIALTAGLQQCRGARVLVLDADLQDPPELLPPMMALMDGGADVVYGQRRTRQGETWFKMTTATLYYRLLNRLVDIEIPRDTGDFRLMNRRVLDILNAMPEQHRFIRGMVSWIGLNQVPIAYDRAARFAGATRYPLRRMVRLAFDGITGFSIIPLRIAAYCGMLTGVVGMLMLFYSLGSWLFSNAAVGWTSLTTIILVLGSAQLMVLGIIGEYLGRLYLESKHRPIYLIDRIIGQDAPARLRVGK